jgi:hypothetical protein
MVAMKKIIIPRRDHEVYFIPVLQAFGPKQVRSFAAAQMEKLHPGFSGEAALDIKRLVFNKARWAMVTVMEAETLEEYRVLHRGTRFFTNTSIAVYKKDFLPGGIKTIGDERIGFDSEKGAPVSIPLESGVSESRQTEQSKTGDPSRPKAMKAIPARSVVFARKKRAWRITAMIACAMAPLPLLFFPAAKDAGETARVPVTVKAAEPPQLKYPPPAIEILSDFSAALFEAGGKITRWRYNESASPLVVIETRGMDVLSLRNAINQYSYVVLEDISDVRYIDGESQFSVSLTAVRNGYVTPTVGTFFSQNFSLPIYSDLTGEFRRNGISIISETLPSDENGNALYTVTYTAKDRDLIRSMEIITGICDKYPVRVKGMDVSIGGEGSLFTVVCSLSQSDAPRYTIASLGDERAYIPKAFGYKEPAPPPLTLPPQKVASVQVQEPQTSQAQEIKPELSIVGTIRDGQGQVLFYRDNEDNKIKTMESFAKP